MSDRLFDKRNYSARTMEIYEILSAYYVDIFYNHLYTEAKKLKAHGNVHSVTEGYKHTLNAFLKGLNKPKLYKKSLVGIHHYFISIGLASITFSRCVDKITAEFVPTDYFASLTSTQKMGVLRMVINQCIKRFIRKIVDEHMVKIIDNHKERDNVRILQDALIDCLILEREGMYQRFIAQQTTSKKTEKVDLLIAERMQGEIKKLVREKYEQKQRIALLTKAYHMHKSKNKAQMEEIYKLKQRLQNTHNPVRRRAVIHSQHSPQYQRHLPERKHNAFQQHPSPVQRPPSPVQSPPSPVQRPPSPVQRPPSPVQRPPSPVQRPPSPPVIETAPESPKNMSPLQLPSSENSYIEVNNDNISTIVHGDSEYFQQLSDTRIFNDRMDDGTTLDDYT